MLILDEWLLCDLHDTEARDLLEIIEARHKRASTIFISQFAPKGWHGKIGEGTLAGALAPQYATTSCFACPLHMRKTANQ